MAFRLKSTASQEVVGRWLLFSNVLFHFDIRPSDFHYSWSLGGENVNISQVNYMNRKTAVMSEENGRWASSGDLFKPTTRQADGVQTQQPPWRDKGLFYFVRSDPGLKELLSSEGLLTRSSAAPLLNQTQRYSLGVHHKYEEVSVHMLPHDKTCTQPHNDL